MAAVPRAKLSMHAVLWALKSVVTDRMFIARVAATLASSWHTVKDAVLAAGRALVVEDPQRFKGVKVIGFDEHRWGNSSRRSHYVTVVIDLTPFAKELGVPGCWAWSRVVPKTYQDLVGYTITGLPGWNRRSGHERIQ